MKTSELTGAALDWAVAGCQNVEIDDDGTIIWFGDGEGLSAPIVPYSPSTDWSIGGPIIERECMELKVEDPNKWLALMWWDDENSSGDIQMYGPTPLIAAMRCFVASKLGDEVEIPKELS